MLYTRSFSYRDPEGGGVFAVLLLLQFAPVCSHTIVMDAMIARALKEVGMAAQPQGRGGLLEPSGLQGGGTFYLSCSASLKLSIHCGVFVCIDWPPQCGMSWSAEWLGCCNLRVCIVTTGKECFETVGCKLPVCLMATMLAAAYGEWCTNYLGRLDCGVPVVLAGATTSPSWFADSAWVSRCVQHILRV